MKKAILFLNKEADFSPLVGLIIDKFDLVIGVDGGTTHVLEQGLIPHVVIGDFDSLPVHVLRKLRSNTNVRFVAYPPDKDQTDAELAIDYARKLGYRLIVMVGLSGSRLDHMTANVLLPSLTKYRSLDIRFIDGKQELLFVRKSVLLTGTQGDLVSLIPIKNNVRGITTKGLLYPLQNETLNYGSTRGISNQFIAATAEINVKKGTLLIIVTRNK